MDRDHATEYACRMDLRQVIGNNIVRLREQRGLTQIQLSQLVGMSQGSLSQWENGLKPDALGDFAAKFEAAGFDPLDLIRLEDRPTAVDPITAAIMADLAALPRDVCESIAALLKVLRGRLSAEQAEAMDVLARLRAQDPSLYEGILGGARGLLRERDTAPPSKGGIE